MERELLKFKHNADGVLVKYHEEREGEAGDTITLESEDQPTTELKAALKDMAIHLLNICELPVTMEKDIEIIGVTITHNEETGRGIVITGLRKLRKLDAPLVLNSPHTTDISMACGLALAALESQVWGYVNGERQQLTLAFPTAEQPALVGG